MSAKLVSENTGWEVALEIAIARDKNVQRLCKAVLNNDYKAAKLIAKELEDDEEGDRVNPRQHRITSIK